MRDTIRQLSVFHPIYRRSLRRRRRRELTARGQLVAAGYTIHVEHDTETGR